MAARRKAKKKRSRNKKSGAGFGQKFLLAVTSIALILSAASVTYGFFFRHVGRDGQSTQFRVEVLNGTGHSGLAHQARRGLLHRGIDVIKVDNADHFEYAQSLLVVRKKGAEVEKLARMLGCDNVVEQLKDDTLEDASLILGADYRSLRLEWSDN